MFKSTMLLNNWIKRFRPPVTTEQYCSNKQKTQGDCSYTVLLACLILDTGTLKASGETHQGCLTTENMFWLALVAHPLFQNWAEMSIKKKGLLAKLKRAFLQRGITADDAFWLMSNHTDRELCLGLLEEDYTARLLPVEILGKIKLDWSDQAGDPWKDDEDFLLFFHLFLQFEVLDRISAVCILCVSTLNPLYVAVVAKNEIVMSLRFRYGTNKTETHEGISLWNQV